MSKSTFEDMLCSENITSYEEPNITNTKYATNHSKNTILGSGVSDNFLDSSIKDPVFLKEICIEYEKLISEGAILGASSEGKARAASGNLFESFIDTIISKLNSTIISVKGSEDQLTSKAGYSLEEHRANLHVDRHLFTIEDGTSNRIRYAFIESKTYLDASYLTRTIFNFIEIKRALNQSGSYSNNLKFLIFCGQNAIADDTKRYYQAFFHEMTGNKLEIFFINDVKQRLSGKQVLTEKFNVDLIELQRFIEYILK